MSAEDGKSKEQEQTLDMQTLSDFLTFTEGLLIGIAYEGNKGEIHSSVSKIRTIRRSSDQQHNGDIEAFVYLYKTQPRLYDVASIHYDNSNNPNDDPMEKLELFEDLAEERIKKEKFEQEKRRNDEELKVFAYAIVGPFTMIADICGKKLFDEQTINSERAKIENPEEIIKKAIDFDPRRVKEYTTSFSPSIIQQVDKWIAESEKVNPQKGNEDVLQ